jgi:uncharacterized protein YbbK (DUF523 family)
LGKHVRYDGGHKLDRFLLEALESLVEFMPVCPESECGLGIPREKMHIKRYPAFQRLVAIKTEIDYTDQIIEWAETKLKQLESENLCGFIFKSRSPSCGVGNVEIYNFNGTSENKGTGIFAGKFMTHFPSIPVADNEHLHDKDAIENFIRKIKA